MTLDLRQAIKNGIIKTIWRHYGTEKSKSGVCGLWVS